MLVEWRQFAAKESVVGESLQMHLPAFSMESEHKSASSGKLLDGEDDLL
jgi:hypothetical protein